MEGTWALPDTPEAQQKLTELMGKELIVGPDATNATEQLYDVIGDDQLFDILGDLAQRDPRANIWDDTDVQARLAELGIQTPQSTEAEPNNVAQDTAPRQQGMAEGDNLATFESINQLRRSAGLPVLEGVLTDSTGGTLEHIKDTFKRDIKDFVAGGEMSNDLFHALYDYYFDDMPYGVKKARDGDPHEWVAQRFYDDLGMSMPVTNPIKTLDEMPILPENSCNMTAEGEYCPEHGLTECGTVAGGMAPVIGEAPLAVIPSGSVAESTSGDILARIKSLALIR
jgi:hypothetical protein